MGASQETAGRQTTHRLRSLFLLLLALGIRLWLAPMRGHVHDIAQLKEWTRTAVTGNPLALYSESTANYPPLALLPLAGVGGLYHLFSPEFDLSSPGLTALIKLPAVVADLVTAVLIYRLVRREAGERLALTWAALYAFNPAVCYTSAWWGQLEALYTLAMLLSVAALAHGRTGRAWGWLAAGVLVKPQAAIIAPVLLVASWREGGWRALAQGGLAAGSVVVLVLAPLAWAGQLPALWAQLRASAGQQRFLTMNAHNLWYLLSLGRGSFAARGDSPITDTQPLIGPFTGWQLGLALLGAWCLLVCAVLWRRSQPGLPVPDLYLPAAALTLGFFMLPAESHERYLFPVLALLAPILPGSRPARWLYAGLSLTLFLNLLWVDPAVPLPGFAEALGWGLPMALANTAALAVTGWALIRSGRGGIG
jgi:dolichyl-phosphate-mannose-protein mannosyltransferase